VVSCGFAASYAPLIRRGTDFSCSGEHLHVRRANSNGVLLGDCDWHNGKCYDATLTEAAAR
jgi:hypothetical protein